MKSEFLCEAMPFTPVYVLSTLKLYEHLQKWLPAKTDIKCINCLDENDGNSLLDVGQFDHVKNVEILLCDSILLAANYKSFPNLKWAHSTWAGVEPLMEAISSQKPFPSFFVTRHAGKKFSDIMAEYVVCQILNCERNMSYAWKNQQSKTWAQVGNFSGFRSLDSLTVSILGIGNMGFGIAKFLKSRGSTILGFSRSARDSHSKEFSAFDRISTDLSEILPECDFLCNTLPNTSETCGLLNDMVLNMCKKKPVFINVGRGNVIKESCLIKALRNGWLSGAVLDVFEEEPLPSSSELWNMPKVTITPHIAALSKPEHVAEEFAENYKRYINGEKLEFLVNWLSRY